MRKHAWIGVHKHTNPLNGGALGAGAMDSVPGVGVAPSSVEDPFFIADPSSILTTPPPLTLRFKNLGGDYYQVIASANGDGNTDAYVLIDDTSLLLNLVDNPGSLFSAVELLNSGVFVEGKQIVIESTGTANDSKVYLDSNVGVVLADRTSDPDGAHSEQAQLYWDSVNKVFRVYDGTNWFSVVTTSPAFAPTVGFAELNSNASTSGTPNTVTTIDFDTFYDVDGVAGSLPAGLALTYSGGSFTATEDGIWVFNMGFVAVVSPGTAGYLQLNSPDYGVSPKIGIAASGNVNVLDKERTVRMRATQSFQVSQANAGSSVDQIDGYAVLNIMRIANAVQ